MSAAILRAVSPPSRALAIVFCAKRRRFDDGMAFGRFDDGVGLSSASISVSSRWRLDAALDVVGAADLLFRAGAEVLVDFLRFVDGSESSSSPLSSESSRLRFDDNDALVEDAAACDL